MNHSVPARMLAMCLLLAAAAPGASTTAKQAADILRQCNVHGGLVVHVGCGDGRLAAALRASEGYTVHGLDTDAANVRKARAHIRSLGLYGKVAVDTFDGANLPYVSGTANLVVADTLANVPRTEALRVLAPGGALWLGGQKVVKPWPSDIDEWTHYLHDADNNAVANDTVVGPPRRLQWQCEPKWTRHHDRMSSVSALVSTGGRIFYIIDEGSTASIFLPSHWALVARDAFNGKFLWRHKLGAWYSRFKGLKDGPADAPRRLVAADGRVYVTSSLEGPVACLNAITGEKVREYRDT
ncbi:methyltransferase domain-containing protein, partial [bacterium]|nr:methyltransferase domain-containing protein [bacterium]